MLNEIFIFNLQQGFFFKILKIKGMKNNNSKLAKRLSQYGTFALAAIGTAEADGQVVYTDVDPDFSGSTGSSYAIDLDNNGVDDVIIEKNMTNLSANPEGSNGILGSGSNINYAYPYALNSGDNISSGVVYGNFLNGVNGNLMYPGVWDNVTDKYLGVEFDISGSTHYGWIRLDVAANGNFTVKDFAYESSPGAGIKAGEKDYIYKNGSWTPSNPDGVSSFTDNILIENGTASLTGDTKANNIEVMSGATLKIEAVLTPDGHIQNDGSIVFVNDATKLGQLDDMTGVTITGVGDVTVERYIPALRAFRFISSAVTTTTSIHDNWQEGATSSTDDPNPGYGTHITGSTIDQQNGFDGTATGNPSMFGFDSNTQLWKDGIDNTDVNTLTAGEAWRLFVRGDRTTDLTNNNSPATNTILRATGDLVVGDYTNSNLSEGFNFIGNPYQAIVDMNDVLFNSTNLNILYYYIWDTNQNERGGYVLVNLPNGTPTPPGSSANEFLQPGQAAFVSTWPVGSLSYSIVFKESYKAVDETPSDVFKPTSPISSIALSLFESNAFASGGTSADGFLINFDPNGNNGIDAHDAAKLFNIDENVGLVNSSGYFIMENRAMPVVGEVLQLYNNNYRHTDYVFQIEVNNLNNVTAYLVDGYLGTQTQLASGTNLVNFSVDESIPASLDTNRFSIVFEKLSVEQNTVLDFEVYPNPATGGRFFVSAPGMAGEKIHVSLYDLLGKNVFDEEMNVGMNNRIEVETDKLQPGVYMLRLKTESGKSFARKLVIEE